MIIKKEIPKEDYYVVATKDNKFVQGFAAYDTPSEAEHFSFIRRAIREAERSNEYRVVRVKETEEQFEISEINFEDDIRPQALLDFKGLFLYPHNHILDIDLQGHPFPEEWKKAYEDIQTYISERLDKLK